jgi:serine/threonine-protein kinase RsbW
MTDQDDVVNEATLSVGDSILLGPVLGRVVGMLAARAQAPIDRLDDALLLTDAVAAHAPGHADGGRVTVHVRTDRTGLQLTVASLAAGGAEALIRSASLPGVGNVLERVADEVRAGAGELQLSLIFRT